MLRTWYMTLLALAVPLCSLAQEICDNAVDDDADGLIDLNDPDCPCAAMLNTNGTPSSIRNHSFEEMTCCPYGFVSGSSAPWLDCATGWHQATTATTDYLHTCGFAPVGMPMPPPDGQGAAGFQVVKDLPWFEYVGTCLAYLPPSNILQAGTTYTLSLWIAGAVSDGQLAQTYEEGRALHLFPDPLPLAIFGHADACVPFPLNTTDCIGTVPGWQELGRVSVQPAWDWVRVSITFTPAQNMHSVIIGSACDPPDSFGAQTIESAQGTTRSVYAYFLVDDLMLTEAQDQVLSPTVVVGSLCEGDARAMATPPAGATHHQWYLDGVAIPGQTSTTLDIANNGLGTGLYTMTSDYDGQCLMGAAPLVSVASPRPWPRFGPSEGCAPLTVAFADASAAGTATVQWLLGDGSIHSDSAFQHTFDLPGTYDVRLRISDDTGCTHDTLLVNAITVHPAPNAAIGLEPTTPDPDHPVVVLAATGSNNIVSWWWDLGPAQPGTATSSSIQATFPAQPGEHPILLVVQTAEGCVDTVRSVVVVRRSGAIDMPNVFSPNGDDRNDRFVPLGSIGVQGTLEVYNRWGQLVFATDAIAHGWDGHGDGGPVPDGTYYYVITPADPRNERTTGHVTLLR